LLGADDIDTTERRFRVDGLIGTRADAPQR